MKLSKLEVICERKLRRLRGIFPHAFNSKSRITATWNTCINCKTTKGKADKMTW